MKILRVANVIDNRMGGMSRTMYCLGDEFVKLGHQVDYVFSDSFRCLGPRQVHRFTGAWEASRLVIDRLTSNRGYDIVEMHEPIAAVYAQHRQTNRKLPPLVLFSYGLEERGLEAMLEYRRAKGIVMPLKSYITSLLLVKQANYGIKRADHIVCSNATDVAYLVGEGISERRITRHHSGVEPEFLAASKEVTMRDTKRILFLGSWIERKGILDLIHAVEQLFQWDLEVTLTLAGTMASPETVLSNFSSVIRERITVVPSIVGTHALIELYRRHDVFVLPSYFEGQPLSLIEAAAMGLVPVVTDIGGNRDFVQHGVNGILVKVGTAKELAEQLLKIAREPEFAGRLASNARHQAKQYTWAAAAENLLRGYERFLPEAVS